MLKTRYAIAFLITLLIYSLLITSYSLLQKQYITPQKKDQAMVLSLTAFDLESTPKTKQPLLLKKEKILTAIPIKKIPTISKALAIEPIKKTIATPTIKKPKKPAKKKVVQHKKLTTKKTPSNHSQSMATQAFNSKKSNLFLSKVKAKINKAKYSLKMSVYMGLQGTVKIQFILLKNGDIGQLSISGPKAFHRSARQAVQQSFPINIQNIPFSLPKKVNLTLKYQFQ